jgi:hypothetical protein
MGPQMVHQWPTRLLYSLWYIPGVKNKAAKSGMFMRRLLEAVKDIKQALRKQTESLQTAPKIHEPQKGVAQEVKAEIRFDEQTRQATTTEQNRTYGALTWTRWGTWAAVGGAIAYATIAAVQVNEMRRATILATQQLDVTERPWMKMDLATVGPLVMDQSGMTIHLRVVLQNTGHSPAVAVLMQPKLLVHSSWPEMVITNEREKLCADLKQTSTRNEKVQEIYFPGTETNSPKVWTISVPRSDLDIADKEEGGSLMPLVISCVVYRPTFDTTFHETSYSSIIMTFDPSAKFVIGSFIPDAPDAIIKPERLVMENHLYAD